MASVIARVENAKGALREAEIGRMKAVLLNWFHAMYFHPSWHSRCKAYQQSM